MFLISRFGLIKENIYENFSTRSVSNWVGESGATKTRLRPKCYSYLTCWAARVRVYKFVKYTKKRREEKVKSFCINYQ